jgi:large subunit ribosomal protein L29
MKSKEIRELTNEEILVRIREEEDTLTRINFNHAISAVENPLKIRTSRKTIARLKTILNERLHQQIAANA